MYSFQLTNLPQLIKNQYGEIVVFNLLKICTERIKNSKYHLTKNKGLNYTTVLSKSQKDQELVSSLHNRTKYELEIFDIIDSNI